MFDQSASPSNVRPADAGTPAAVSNEDPKKQRQPEPAEIEETVDEETEEIEDEEDERIGGLVGRYFENHPGAWTDFPAFEHLAALLIEAHNLDCMRFGTRPWNRADDFTHAARSKDIPIVLELAIESFQREAYPNIEPCDFYFPEDVQDQYIIVGGYLIQADEHLGFVVHDARKSLMRLFELADHGNPEVTLQRLKDLMGLSAEQ